MTFCNQKKVYKHEVKFYFSTYYYDIECFLLHRSFLKSGSQSYTVKAGLETCYVAKDNLELLINFSSHILETDRLTTTEPDRNILSLVLYTLHTDQGTQ